MNVSVTFFRTNLHYMERILEINFVSLTILLKNIKNISYF